MSDFNQGDDGENVVEVAEVFGIGEVLGADDAPAADDPPAPAEPEAPAAEAKPGGEGEVPPSPPEPAPAPPPAEAKPSAPPAPSAAPKDGAAPTPPAPPVAPSADALRMQSLEAQVEALQTQLAAASKKPEGSEPAPTDGSDKKAEKPLYSLGIPKQLSEAIFGEDPAKAEGAMHLLVNALATTIHTRVLEAVKAEFQKLADARQSAEAETDAEAQVRAAREDYFKAFPEHNDPLIHPLLNKLAGQMAAEFPGLRWSEDYRNALGARVKGALAKLGVKPAETPAEPAPPAAPPTPPRRPASFLPTGPRDENLPNFGNEGDLIADTFGFG